MRRNLPWMLLLLALAVALATGGVTINRTGAAVIGVCLLSVGLWYAATDATLGRWMANSASPAARIFKWIVWVWELAFGIAISWLYIKPDGSLVWLGVAFLLVGVGWQVRRLLGWLGRRRSSGGLLLDLSTHSPRGAWSLVVLFGLLTLSMDIYVSRDYIHRCSMLAIDNARSADTIMRADISLICDPGDLHGYLNSTLLVFLSSQCFVLYWFLSESLEIRGRGIVYAGALYEWERIEWREWSDKPIPRAHHLRSKDCLKLRLCGGIHFIPFARVFVPPHRREEVDAIMSRYLSEWPATRKTTSSPD